MMRGLPTGWDRGQSTIIGISLLIGLVLVGATLTVAVGGVALNDLQSNAQEQRARTSMSEFDSRASSIAHGDSSVKGFETGLNLRGNASMQYQETGKIRVRTQSGTKLLPNQTLGTILYESGQERYAYQGGGVWRGAGADSAMISPPEFHFTGGTVTMPLVRLDSGDGSLGSSFRISKGSYGTMPADVSSSTSSDVYLEQYNRQDYESGNRTSYRVGGKRVQVFVHSKYYAGWATYFRERVSDVTVKTYPKNETTRVKLGRLGGSTTFDTAVTAAGGGVGIGTGSPEIDGPVTTEGTVEDPSLVTGSVTENANVDQSSIDGLIDDKISDAPSNADRTFSPSGFESASLTGGNTYYVTGDVELDDSSDNVTADISNGKSIELIVDGYINVSGDGAINVTGASGVDDNTALRVYTNSDLTMSGGGYMFVGGNKSVDARHLQIYGKSDMQVGMANDVIFEGILYAPRENEVSGENTAFPTAGNQCARSRSPPGAPYGDVCIATGSAQIDGAVNAGPISVRQDAQLTYDESLADAEVLISPGEVVPPPVAHLHVSVTELDIEST